MRRSVLRIRFTPEGLKKFVQDGLLGSRGILVDWKDISEGEQKERDPKWAWSISILSGGFWGDTTTWRPTMEALVKSMDSEFAPAFWLRDREATRVLAESALLTKGDEK